MKVPTVTMNRVLAFLLAVLTGLATPAWAQNSQDTIGPRDKLTVRVYEWRTNTGEPYEWEALSGDFVVGGNGQVSMPLVGSVPVGGLLPEDAATMIGRRLQEAIGLRNTPSASVQITTFRPFYIVGSVDKPGEYPFRPDLTVLQAISIAGGLRRASDNVYARFERDAITARGDMRVLSATVTALSAAQARLRAEIDGIERITFPPELMKRRDDPEIARLIAEEELIFRSKLDNMKKRIEANERLRALLTDQTKALRSQSALKEQQIASARREFDDARRLVDRGLATAPRQLALERSVADYEAGLFEIQRAITDAQVRIAEAERTILDLRSRQRDEALLELRQNQTRLAEATEKFETARRLVQEAEVTAPSALARTLTAQRGTEPTYSIVRRVDGKVQEFEATEATSVLPGDTVRVTVPLPEVLSGVEPVGGRPRQETRARAGVP